METSISYAPVFSFRFLRALFIHMRPYLLFVSGAAGFAGIALGWSENHSIIRFLLVFLPIFLGYGFGQALTDCFQVDTDSISATYRPLVRKEVSPKALGIVSFAGLVAIGIPLIWLNPSNTILCLLAIFGLATYTYFKKNFWMAGPFYNGWIVMILPIVAFLATSGTKLSAIPSETLLWVCIITLFSYANFVLIGYLKDITADRQTGYNTFAVKFGWNASVLLGDIFLAIVLVSCLIIIDTEKVAAFLTFLLASLIAISGQWKAHVAKVKTEEHSAYPIASTVRAFILWHLAIALQFQPKWLVFAISYYIAFEAVLWFRPEKNQI